MAGPRLVVVLFGVQGLSWLFGDNCCGGSEVLGDLTREGADCDGDRARFLPLIPLVPGIAGTGLFADDDCLVTPTLKVGGSCAVGVSLREVKTRREKFEALIGGLLG